jgi:DNA topoisomerase-3
MEGAGKLVEDEELREAMIEKGLGTAATRAQIIEGLIWEKYVNRNGRELQPTAKAFSLITLLRGLGIPELSSPELTGDWEFKLRQMTRDSRARGVHARDRTMTRDRARPKFRERHGAGDFGTLMSPPEMWWRSS